MSRSQVLRTRDLRLGGSWRRVLIWLIPAVVTLAWLTYVSTVGHWDRVTNHWESSLTMLFGSFVAGSTPQGGGAIAFPVMTKALQVPADVARTFSLCIQAVGMVVASAVIILARRRIEAKPLIVAGSAGVVGFLAGLFLLGDHDSVFWPSLVPAPYVKVTFTVILAAMAYIVWLSLKEGDCGELALPVRNTRVRIGVIAAGLVGGVASALTGSGVDVFLFLFLVVLAGLHPRVGVPTSIIAMALVSTLGFILLGLVDGQLATEVNGAGDVVSVGGNALPQTLPGSQFDVFGLWLAAVPIVVWGAPLGAYLVDILREGRLIAFVAGMAALEVVSTAVFLDELRTDPTLALYGIAALVATIVLVRWLTSNRHRLLDLHHLHA